MSDRTSYSLLNRQRKQRLRIDADMRSGVKAVKRLLIGMIRFYQKYLSGLKRYSHCIYIPTCSQYAIEALEKHGVLKGSILTIWRILRCNPFAKGGFDPVP